MASITGSWKKILMNLHTQMLPYSALSKKQQKYHEIVLTEASLNNNHFRLFPGQWKLLDIPRKKVLAKFEEETRKRNLVRPRIESNMKIGIENLADFNEFF
uniref:Uncharacterized protein n=1 Tax=Rhizophagus irregularis (strain DAOM 181602 / DAOM 197198 / MUCL 43194) TaxID=747089 RepID=U9TRW4_RHIID